jgi:AcrR family transcriptional regulator
MSVTQQATEQGLRERKKEATRERLTAAALELFRERGFEGATVEMIADRADVSVTTFFRYFPSKEDAVLAKVLEIQAQVEAALHDRPAGTTVVEELRRILPEALEHGSPMARNRDAVRAFGCVPELHQRIREHGERICEAVTAEIAKDLRLPPEDLTCRVLAAAIYGALDASRSAWADGAGGESYQECLAQTLDIVERMVTSFLPGPD